MTVRIVDDNQTERIVCPSCDVVLEYQKSDVGHAKEGLGSSTYIPYIICPKCEQGVRVDPNWVRKIETPT